jgi:hypothetical protein
LDSLQTWNTDHNSLVNGPFFVVEGLVRPPPEQRLEESNIDFVKTQHFLSDLSQPQANASDLSLVSP